MATRSLLSVPLDVADEEPDHITLARRAVDKLDLQAARKLFEKEYNVKIQQWIDNREKQWQWQLKLWASEASQSVLHKGLSQREAFGDASNQEKRKPLDKLADDVFTAVWGELRQRWEAECWVTEQNV